MMDKVRVGLRDGGKRYECSPNDHTLLVPRYGTQGPFVYSISCFLHRWHIEQSYCAALAKESGRDHQGYEEAIPDPLGVVVFCMLICESMLLHPRVCDASKLTCDNCRAPRLLEIRYSVAAENERGK